MRLALTLAALLTVGPHHYSAHQSNEEPFVSGRILDPDGAPVTTGSVAMITSPTQRVTASISRTGEFRLVPDAGQRQSLFISVPGFAPYRAYLDLPSSRRMTLPTIQLTPATYFRARFVTTDGEPLGGSLRRRSIDADGAQISDPLDHTRERVEPDGSVTVGPLPPGRLLLAFDRPGWAQTRVRDALVNGAQPLIDGGTIVVGAGGTLRVEVVDAAGAPVRQHNVWIEDAVQPSPLFFSPMKTNAEGRAEFTRLASGRYRVWTQTVERCGGAQSLAVSRLASSSGSGVVQARLVVGGTARLRITSALGALNGKSITISPDAPNQAPWQFVPSDAMLARRLAIMRSSPAGCNAQTDTEGRAAVAPFPPGPAEVRIPLINSTFITRVSIPERGSEVAIAIPDGLIPVKTVDAASHRPIGNVVVSWRGGGHRVEAITNANGDALIEAPGAAGGTLTLSSREYETLEGAFPETPDTLQEVAMTRLPSDRVEVRVMSDDHAPVAGAAVLLASTRLGDPDEIATTDAKGVARFMQIPAGALRVIASATGFDAMTKVIAASQRDAITLTLMTSPQ